MKKLVIHPLCAAALPQPVAPKQLVAYQLVETDDGRLTSGDSAEYPVYPFWRGAAAQ